VDQFTIIFYGWKIYSRVGALFATEDKKLPAMSQPAIAILDDYQQVAFQFADWTEVRNKAAVTVFPDHLADETALITRLLPFNAICVMRERTPLTRQLLSRLPNLKLIVSTGKRNASIDTAAASELGIKVAGTGYHDSGAPELTWALLLALARHIVPENAALRVGAWQQHVGSDLSGKTIGVVGLGRIGSTIARYAGAFNMEVIAWSENLTPEKAAAAGARLVTKDQLFQQADFVTVHLVLSDRSRGTVTARELRQMKRSAYFINTSRGPLVDEAALIQVLRDRSIAGAALDVFDTEPLPADYPLRSFDNVLATPHIGYVTSDTYRIFYQDTVKALLEWLR
jgi:phosphoglycerate dehydrogenase-like enzyme